MNTYMKKNGAECCYVKLAFDGQQLVLTKPKGFFQERLVEIPVDEISHLTCDEHFGSQRINLIHHNVTMVLYMWVKCDRLYERTIIRLRSSESWQTFGILHA